MPRRAVLPRQRVFGALLVVGGATYVLDASLALLAPALGAAINGVTALPLALGELSMVAWLLIKAVRGHTSRALAQR